MMDRIDRHGSIAVRRRARNITISGFQMCRRPAWGGDDPRGAHYVKHTRDEAEQKKYNEPPGRDTEQPVDQPTKAGADQHASNEFA